MEPRIARLLGDSAAIDPTSLPHPPPTASRRPLPVEPSPGGDDALTNTSPRRHDCVGKDVHGDAWPQTRSATHHQTTSIPIAEVLNDEAPSPPALPPLAPLVGISNTPTQPFSGRLQDILIDPSQERPYKRKKGDGHTTPPALTGNENTLLTLPKLPQLPKKPTRRPRIPPLLQGLHQPPPLPPDARLFPPITGEGGGFRRDMGDRVSLRSPIGLDKGKDKDKAASSPSSTNQNNKENHTQDSVGAPGTIDSGGKRPKKRNKWSEQETKDLLQGVSMFGIGSWKRILNHPEFYFNQRTTVDLKDRFRTCCPGDVAKSKKTSSTPTAQDNTSPTTSETSNLLNSTGLSKEVAAQIEEAWLKSKPPRRPRKARSDQDKKTPAELAEMGIQGPFEPSKRRPRHEFTDQDDLNLWEGFKKYGPVWHAIRREYGFNKRHPTDLRDRFRNRYPEHYVKAGYKVTPTKKRNASAQNQSTDVLESEHATSSGNPEQPVLSDQDIELTASSGPSIAGLRGHTLLQPLRNSFPTQLEDFPDLFTEDEAEGGHSPITLSRHIFQWADANPSQGGLASTSSSMPTIASLTGDIGFNVFTGTDGMHIDPQALRLQTAPSQNNTLTTMPSHTSNSQYLAPPGLASLSAGSNMPPSNPTSMTGAATNHSSRQSMSSLLRTPNLPTIVFPHVPVASARNTMHNLPPPADLLSGVDTDFRADQQSVGFALDESTHFGALPSTATLAPMTANVQNNTGRGIMSTEKDSRGKGPLGDEPLGERSLLNSSI
jgi:hypothetical protein